jgi:flagellar basal-body rod modification protein FlgD
MQIDPSASPLAALTSPAPAAEGAAPAAPRDQFLRLLVAQLQHQNPLDPQDGAEFVAQLAQFSSLEQATETNQRLAALEAAQTASARASLTYVVGHGVTAAADTLRYDPGRGPMPPLVAELGAGAQKVEVVVTDAEGREVRRIPLGAHAAGQVNVPWDGTDRAGRPLPPGEYHIAVEASGEAGAPVLAHARLRGVASALVFGADGGNRFRIGGVEVMPADIVSIEEWSE